MALSQMTMLKYQPNDKHAKHYWIFLSVIWVTYKNGSLWIFIKFG